MTQSHLPAVLNPERAMLLELANLRKTIARAYGSYLYTEDGDAYLDFTSQYGVHVFGHNPDFLWDVLLNERSKQQPTMIQPLETAGARELATQLLAVAPGDMTQVTFTNSGAECMEAAVKMARAKTQRPNILSTTNSFHGKTMAAVLATGNAFYREGFYPKHEEFVHIPFNDLEALEQELASRSYAAFVVEPIQGEGGMVTPHKGYLKACEDLCARYRTLLVVDEVQTGLGRTGALFACEHEGVKPDILLLAKALGGGLFPLGAVLANARSWSAEFGMRHSSTFTNNHLACRIGLAVLNKLQTEPQWLHNAQTLGQHLEQGLANLAQRYPSVFHSPSGQGLMRGIKLCRWRDEDSYFSVAASHLGLSVPLVASYLLNKHGVLTAPTLNASNTLRIQPNLTITAEEIDRLLTALDDVGEKISNHRLSDIVGASTTVYPRAERQAPTLPAPFVVAKPKLGTFAFLVHPTTDNDLLASLPGGVEAYSASELNHLQTWFERYKTLYAHAAPSYYLPCCPSASGGYVDGWLISSPLTPQEMVKLSKQEKQNLLDSYIQEAQALKADVIGLGAFTSVISRSGDMVAGCGTPVTTGNAYTALTSTEAVRQVCRHHGIKLNTQQVAVVGARGSVGRLVALDIAGSCQRLVLVGNPRNAKALEGLQELAGEICEQLLCDAKSTSPIATQLANLGGQSLYQQWRAQGNTKPSILYQTLLSASHADHFPIAISVCVETALKPCHVVITATSNGEAFVQPEHLAMGAVVCDAARPSDLIGSIGDLRPDLIVFHGGLARLPADIRFGRSNILGFETGINLACLAETMTLTMAKVQCDYSIGGISGLAEARQVYAFAQQHGFACHVPETALSSKHQGHDHATCV